MRGSWLAILKAEHDEANAWDSGLEVASRGLEEKKRAVQEAAKKGDGPAARVPLQRTYREFPGTHTYSPQEKEDIRQSWLTVVRGDPDEEEEEEEEERGRRQSEQSTRDRLREGWMALVETPEDWGDHRVETPEDQDTPRVEPGVGERRVGARPREGKSARPRVQDDRWVASRGST